VQVLSLRHSLFVDTSRHSLLLLLLMMMMMVVVVVVAELVCY